MQPLEKQTLSASALQEAGEVLEVMMLVMRTVRREMGAHPSPELSVSQFRMMDFVHHHPHTSLSEAADFIGLSLPTMSKLVDMLVERELLLRQPHADDRRRVALAVTPAGSAMMERARAKAQRALAELLATRSEPERRIVLAAMQVLRPALDPGGRVRPAGPRQLQEVP